MTYKIEGKEAEVVRKLMTNINAAQAQLVSIVGFIAQREGLEGVDFNAETLTFDVPKEKK